ncbi:nucleotidyl transferase [Yersinia mollaretii]|uniref:nucleotidyltransferase family protein n=1 Tax=Yersinia mollaretii TaxID=33060 RepID=UPI0005EA414F|nr:nucleotidyltransferase family protein [Yersinia mollaretii]CNK28130.1 nucleotidyl transferase [Yersinia mollaretii]
MFPIAILAGGLATRLRPITETIPKALVDVAGVPFISRQLNYLHEQGIERVVLCIGYLGGMIEALVGNGERFGLQVSYSSDGATLLGTGGALRKALPLLGEQFFVLYGDSFLPVDFSAVQRAYVRSGQQGLMTVLKNSDRWDKSNVLFVDGQLVEYNKRIPRAEMAYIDYGLGILSAGVLSHHPPDHSFDLADTYHTLSVRGQLAGMEVQERFYEIGSHSGLKEAEEYFLAKESS